MANHTAQPKTARKKNIAKIQWKETKYWTKKIYGIGMKIDVMAPKMLSLPSLSSLVSSLLLLLLSFSENIMCVTSTNATVPQFSSQNAAVLQVNCGWKLCKCVCSMQYHDSPDCSLRTCNFSISYIQCIWVHFPGICVVLWMGLEAGSAIGGQQGGRNGRKAKSKCWIASLIDKQCTLTIIIYFVALCT